MASAGRDGDEHDKHETQDSFSDQTQQSPAEGDGNVQSSTITIEDGSGRTEESPPELSEQREFVRKHIQPQLIKGEEWYLLDVRWYRQWKKYVGYDCWDTDGAGESSSHPGPIDLSPLCKDCNSASRSLKNGLLDELDYFLVPKLVWEKLLAWYGLADGSEPICRRVVEFGMFTKHCKVEVYLMEFQLAKLGDENSVVTEYFSRADTVGRLKEVTKNALGIPADKECRLYNRFVSSNLELLKHDNETIQEVGLYAGQLLVIEQKKEDGTWPRGEETSRYSSTGTSYSSSYNTGSSYNNKNSSSTYGSTSSTSSSYFGSWGWGSSSHSRPSRPGLCGLSNLGNTCFMNSALQCMSNTSVLTEYFTGGLYKQDINRDNPLGMKGEIATSYAGLLLDMWSGTTSSVAPRTFKHSVSRFAPQFSGFAQHDSHELLAFLLDGLHEDLNRVKKKPYVEMRDSDGRDDRVVASEAWENHLKRNKSIIVELFQGQFKSTLVCPDCQKVSVTFDPFMFLSLPLPTAKTRQLEVLLILMDPDVKPMFYNVTVPKAGAVRDLKRKLSGMCSVAADHLVVTDVYNHRFHKLFQDSEPLSGIQDRDSIYVYEVPVSAADDPDTVVLPVYHRQPRRTTNYYPSYSPSLSLTLCGLPMLVGVPRKTTTYQSLYNALLTQLRRVVCTTSIDSGADTVSEKVLSTTSVDNGASTASEKATLLELSGKDNKNNVAENGVEMEDMSGSSVTNNDSAGQKDAESVEPMDVDGKPDTGNAIGGVAAKGESAVATNVTDANGVDTSETSHESLGNADADTPTSAKVEQHDLFTISSVNSYGSTSIEDLLDNGAPLRLTNRTYISLDWPKDNSAYQEEVALHYGEHPSCQKSSSPPQKKTCNLYDCLGLFTTKEQLGEDDPWYCPDCKKHQQAMKKFDIWKLPKVLVVHLKRFSYTRYWRDKLDTLIDFPVTGLDLSDACLNPDEKSPVYDLYAVSNHYGGLGGGHYTAYAKNAKGGEWHYFDDSSVSSADESQLVTKAAYVLFYTRRDPKSEEKAEAAADAIADKRVSEVDDTVEN